MSTFKDIKDYTDFVEEKFPQFKVEFAELHRVAKSQLEDGVPEQEEVWYFLSDVEDLVGISRYEFLESLEEEEV